jgi:hypothetical protein
LTSIKFAPIRAREAAAQEDAMARHAPLALLALLVGCGSSEPAALDAARCGEVARHDTFTGRGEWSLTIVATNPAPPARSTNWWAVTIDDPDGAPMIDAAALVVSAFMPEHDHSAPAPVTVTAEPDGLVVGPLELSMPGRWEVRFDVEGERIVVPLCIDE